MSRKKLNPTVIFLLHQLKHLYEAARLLANSRQLSLEMSIQYLYMSSIFEKFYSEDISDLLAIWEQYKGICSFLSICVVIFLYLCLIGCSLRFTCRGQIF
jgi:hypothetical protein